MRPRHLPCIWLVSDERLGHALLPSVARLPRGAGVLFRHYATPTADRRALFERVRTIAHARGLVLVLAGSPGQAIAWRADGVHGRRPAPPRLLRTAPAHDVPEIVAAGRRGADLLFVSPVHATRSHPGAPHLGRSRALLLARHASVPVIALGGMSAERAKPLMRAGLHGWAGIDAWFDRPAMP